MPETPLNEDDPGASITLPDGTVVRNLTPAEYEATYAEGEPHSLPPEVLAVLP